MSLRTLQDFPILVEGLDHPECVAWGQDGYLYAGGEAGQVYRISLSGEVEQIASTEGFVLGVCLDGNGRIYTCDCKRQAVLCIDEQLSTTVFSQGTPDRPMKTPNFALFTRDGTLYVSDSGDWHGNNGCIFRIAPGGTTQIATGEAAAFPNGMALSPLDGQLYVIESNKSAVVRLRFEPDGGLSSPELVIELPGTVPDGLAFDSAGALYISCYTPDVIYRLEPDGSPDVVVTDPEHTTIASPTNLAFGGAELKSLIVANLGGYHLNLAKMEVAGAPLHYPQFA